MSDRKLIASREGEVSLSWFSRFVVLFTSLIAVELSRTENDQAIRQLKTLKSKKAATIAAMKKPPARKQMDEAQMKEVKNRYDWNHRQ